MAELVVQALFVVVFVQALVAYVRTRDRVHRDVMLVFSALAALFLLGVVDHVWGHPAWQVQAAATAWLLGQPFWTLRLCAQLRRVPTWVLWAAGAGWAAGSAAFMLAPESQQLPPAAVLVIVVLFLAGQVTAAGLFVAEARARAGSSGMRLWCAAGGTALFALAILVSSAQTAYPRHDAVIRAFSLSIVLASAVGYLLAFMPPQWLREVWSSRAAYRLIRQLLDVSPGESPAAIWQRYVHAVREKAAADAAVVLVPGPDGLLAQASCVDGDRQLADVQGDISELVSARRTVDVRTAARGRPVSALAAELAERTNATYVTAVPLSPPLSAARRAHGEESADIGALVLLNRYRSLFEDDDVALLGQLGAQATVLAEQGRLTAELGDSAELANAANRAKSEFLSSMSHELRTPLNAIIGFSELMGEEETDGQTRPVPNEWIDHVHNSGRHLLGLINDVLDLSKVEAGYIDLFIEPISVATAVDEAVATLRPLLDGKRLQVTTAVPALTVPADRVRFRQMLDNLLSNAIKFTPVGGQIYISAARSGDEAQISITDTGAGIAQADHPRVFKEFTQVGDQGARRGGTGLGLPLARRLAQAHGGDIHLSSAPGHGARFTITLPAVQPAAEGEMLATATTAAFNLGAGGGILVIEDDPAAGMLLATHLGRAGYQVTVAVTGEEGLALARVGEPQLILLDLILPGIDGRTVLQRLKDDPQLRHIPVAIISVADDREVSLALGAVDYFAKPVNHDALLAWLVRRGLIPPLSDRETNVLVIDDDPATHAVIGRTLQRQGLRVVDAANGLDGLLLARSNPFDLIICDLLMPGLDGFSVIAALHDDPATRDIPVLVLTSHDLTDSDRSRLAGKTLDVLTKGDPSTNIENWLQRIAELTRV